ncbi:hypothetical protein HKD37_03G008008 [Glycine soja]
MGELGSLMCRHGNGAGRGRYGYSLPNPLPRLPNISPYSYPIPDRLKFIIPSSYPSGIGYPRPRPIPNTN